jgi:NAD(P)-dependent dehydrogenase (short-subunit alcohol dehydrogenase family)
MAAIRVVAFAAMIGTAVVDYGDVTPAATMRKRPQICSIMSSKEESVDELRQDDASSSLRSGQFLFDPLLTNALDRIDDAVGISEVDPLFYNSFQRIIAVSYKINNEDPINNREEVEERMMSLIVVMRYITLISPLLSATYAIAVHLFLSFWRELSFLDFRFYFRLADCIIFAAFNSIVWVACHRQHALSMSMAIETLSMVVSVAVSSANISQTRKIWVDGPMPPYSNNTTHLKDTNVFITGANSGIGLETSRQLYQRGATIFLGCRSKERALEAMRNIDPTYEIDGDATVEEEKEQRRTARKRRMYFVELDLSSFVSVRGAVRLFLDMNVPLHVLINNAGVMRKDRKLSVDGNEMTMAANHTGHFLLTNLLLPKLRQSAFEVGRPSRVITVSSSLYANARCQCTTSGVVRPGIDLFDLQCERKKYRMFEQYAQSKVANVMFAIELGGRERRRWQDQQTEIAATATPTKKDRKKLRPKLTPNIHTVTEKDELGLGFGDILRTPVAKTTEIKVEEDEDITEGDLVRKKEEKTKLRPKILSGDEYSMDDGGLGFEDFVSARSATKKRLVEVTEEVEDEYMTNDALKSWSLSHPPVLSYCLHPGLVRTDFVRDMPWYLYYLNKVFALFLATLQKTTCAGAFTSIFCVVMDTIDTDVDECYFVNSKIQPILRSASNEEDCKKLWELSDRITTY